MFGDKAVPDSRGDELPREPVETDAALRIPGGVVGRCLFALLLCWSLFQLYIASPLPYMLGRGFIFNDVQSRSIHYAFAIFLAFGMYPAFRSSSRHHIPAADWLWGAVAAGTSLYICILYEELSHRAGAPIPLDMVVASVGIICLLEGVRRSIGLPLFFVSIVFLAYAVAGPWMPAVISHPGASMARMTDHMWLSGEGVFGLTLGVSTNLVFLFVLFGALLERAGAGNWFILSSIALLGHMRGGPAKAAVVSSALTGMISGSALGNIVTTGTFTIPLMKRIGIPAEKAAGIESTASINGQFMPPVMGAAAFLMTEFIGISYADVVKHAFLPAVLSYIGLFYIVHLEAVKLNLPLLQRAAESAAVRRLLAFAMSFLGLVLLSGLVYYGIGWIRVLLGAQAGWAIALLFLTAYVGLVWLSTRMPALPVLADGASLRTLPNAAPTILAGTHYLLPVVVLIWCMMVERYSPGLSVFWAIVALSFIMLTQHPLAALLRGEGVSRHALRAGAVDFVYGLAKGARNMVGVAMALASAGIIVGVVTMTGFGLVMVNVIEAISGGYLLPMLIFTAAITVVLGMGLPTTANYVVVASIMAPVVVTVAGQYGLIVPAVAVHLFVFYFGLMSGNTPPVAVDAYAAAALARSDPLKTCLQGFYYELRTIILPFIFIFNTELLLIGITSWWHLVMTVGISVIAMLVFAAGTQGHFLVRSRRIESALLILVALSLLRPGFWIDQFQPPFQAVDPREILRYAEMQPSGALLRVWAEGPDFSGRTVRKLVVLPLGPKGGDGAARLRDGAGLMVREKEGRVVVDDLVFNGPAQQSGMDFGWEIQTLDAPMEQIDKHWVYIPALLVLGLVVLLQRRRQSGAVGAAAGKHVI